MRRPRTRDALAWLAGACSCAAVGCAPALGPAATDASAPALALTQTLDFFDELDAKPAADQDDLLTGTLLVLTRTRPEPYQARVSLARQLGIVHPRFARPATEPATVGQAALALAAAAPAPDESRAAIGAATGWLVGRGWLAPGVPAEGLISGAQLSGLLSSLAAHRAQTGASAPPSAAPASPPPASQTPTATQPPADPARSEPGAADPSTAQLNLSVWSLQPTTAATGPAPANPAAPGTSSATDPAAPATAQPRWVAPNRTSPASAGAGAGQQPPRPPASPAPPAPPAPPAHPAGVTPDDPFAGLGLPSLPPDASHASTPTPSTPTSPTPTTPHAQPSPAGPTPLRDAAAALPRQAQRPARRATTTPTPRPEPLPALPPTAWRAAGLGVPASPTTTLTAPTSPTAPAPPAPAVTPSITIEPGPSRP